MHTQKHRSRHSTAPPATPSAATTPDLADSPSADKDPLLLKIAYRVPEACAATGYKRSKLYELIKAGKLTIRKDGSCTIILHSELERYLQSLPSVCGSTS